VELELLEQTQTVLEVEEQVSQVMVVMVLELLAVQEVSVEEAEVLVLYKGLAEQVLFTFFIRRKL
jgi:hypothetical protein